MKIDLSYEEATAMVNPFANGLDLRGAEASAKAKIWTVINTSRDAGEELRGPVRGKEQMAA